MPEPAKSEMVKLTINGEPIEAEKGTLLIEAARQNGVEIPAFCYYEGLTLQAACRMCLVEVEKTPKLQVGCILCYRCVRNCNEGMGVGALGISNRGVIAEIIPNVHDHLNCDECGACIDICPVGALTSGAYRYQTRPWEMNHVGTICTHCADGCRTTLGVRNDKIIRGNNRDRSGINGEFLCIKGRYGFDFVDHPERLQSPLMRTAAGY